MRQVAYKLNLTSISTVVGFAFFLLLSTSMVDRSNFTQVSDCGAVEGSFRSTVGNV